MRTLLAVVATALLVIAIGNEAGRATPTAPGANASALELVVFEHPDCTYCQVFRRDVLPRYRQSASAAEAPLRFLDIAKDDTTSLALKGRIDTVPTAVLMKDGREVDRIVGYWGPDNFFKMLAFIIAKAG